MSTHREKEVELRYLSRPTLQQLAKQHNIKANLKSTELVCELLKCWPCKVHSPECMLVQATSNDDDEFNTSMSAPPSSHTSTTPAALSPSNVSLSCFLVDSTMSVSSPLSPRVSFQLPINNHNNNNNNPTYSSHPHSPPDSDFLPPTLTASASPSSDLKARRRTWNIAEVQIGDRLLSPFRGERTRPTRDRRMSVRQSVGLARMEEEEEEEVGGGEREVGGGMERTAFEAANVQQTLRFSTLTEEDEVDSTTTQPSSSGPSLPSSRLTTAATPPNCPVWATGTTTISEKSPQFVGFITSRRGGRPPTAVRQSIRLSSRRQTIATPSSTASSAATRRQTIAPTSSSFSTTSSATSASTAWPATAGPRPLRPTSTIASNNPTTRPTKQKPRFDVAASLARPVTWKMHKGPLAERVNGGGGVKAAEGKVAMERDKVGRDEVRGRQRREMRQKSIDYARNVRAGQRGAGQENSAPAVKQQ